VLRQPASAVLAKPTNRSPPRKLFRAITDQSVVAGLHHEGVLGHPSVALRVSGV
jgi:hypothetical protein